MAEELQGLWTAKGLEKLATHAAGGAALVIEKLALGDGGGSVPTPQASWTALTQEVWRGDINGVDTVDDDPSQVQVDVIIPFSTGGFFIREWGLYDEDDDLIAVGAHAEFYKPVLSSGAAAELLERILLPMANAGAITLSIPTQAMATQDYVQSQIGDHNEDEEAHPDLLDGLDGLGDEIEALDIALGNHEDTSATEEVGGHIPLATEALALAGEDDATAMTPALVKTVIDACRATTDDITDLSTTQFPSVAQTVRLDMSNVSAAGKATAVSWGMPDYPSQVILGSIGPNIASPSYNFDALAMVWVLKSNSEAYDISVIKDASVILVGKRTDDQDVYTQTTSFYFFLPKGWKFRSPAGVNGARIYPLQGNM